MELVVLLRVVLIAVGLAYLAHLVRKGASQRDARRSPSVPRVLNAAASSQEARVDRLERIRARLAIGALACLVPMVASRLVGGPSWLMWGFMVVVGLLLLAYLWYSVASGWVAGGPKD